MDLAAVESSLKRGVISQVYLFYGEETYLRDRLVEQFKQTLLTPEMQDFNLDILDGRSLNLGDLVAMASTLPFMAEKRLVIVRDADFFKSKKKGQQEEGEATTASEDSLIAYLDNPSPAACLIFLADEGIDKRKKLYKLVEKKGQVVYFPLLKGQELNTWVTKRVEQLGGAISREAVSYLTMAVGSNLNLLDQELAKLLTYVGNASQIELAHVEEMVSKQKEITVFQLVDAVAEKRFSLAMEMVQELLFQGETPVFIINLLARQFRLIWLTLAYLQKGYSENQTAGHLQVRNFVVSKCLRQGRSLSAAELERAFRILAETDFRIKSGQQEQKLALEMAIISLCA